MLSEFELTERDMRRLQDIPVNLAEFPQAVGVAVRASQIEGVGLFATRFLPA